MLLAACEQFLGKSDQEIQHIALVTLEGHQRAIMGSMTVEVSNYCPWHKPNQFGPFEQSTPAFLGGTPGPPSSCEPPVFLLTSRHWRIVFFHRVWTSDSGRPKSALVTYRGASPDALTKLAARVFQMRSSKTMNKLLWIHNINQIDYTLLLT